MGPYARTIAQLRNPVLRPCDSRAACGSAKTNGLKLWHAARRRYASMSKTQLQFGQPVFETHPHLLKSGELTPGITALEYHKRRSKLAASLPDRAIAVLAASGTKYRSGSVFYEFHQDSDFFYLTGFNEPDATAVIQNIGQSGSGEYIFHLFVRPKDARAESWDGARSGEQAAIDMFNADAVCDTLCPLIHSEKLISEKKTGDITKLPTLLPPLITGASEVFTNNLDTQSPFSKFFAREDVATSEFRKIVGGVKLKPLRTIMNELRIFKSGAEVNLMRMAGEISGKSNLKCDAESMENGKDLSAFLDYEFKIGGCDSAAYVPVVAGGQNALRIHYVRNDDKLQKGNLILTDAGGELGGYITDITRTWPVSGRFSAAQRDLYEAILRVQQNGISLCRESANVSLDKIHKVTEQGLLEGLKQLGFDMSGNALEVLFPHHVGHYIGLDVHDCPGYSRTGVLKAGQCVTVEPGIYVPNDDRWPAHFRGMGIRIEDSVCVLEDLPLVLTTEAVKEVADIEALRD